MLLRKIRNRIKKDFFRILDAAFIDAWLKRRPFDYERIAYLNAAEESAKYFLENMRTTPNLVKKEALLEHAVTSVTIDGLWLEFGVYKGNDITKISAFTEKTIYGFDSFEGLPEDWTHFQKKGRFSLDGMVPDNMPANVKLIEGWFSDTLPLFLQKHTGPIAFLHIDSDLYSSAQYVLSLLQPQIVEGTVILFDDFLNYPGWQQGEYKAFIEFVEQTKISYGFLGFASSHSSVALRVTGK
jgi:hypothetical protein